MSKNSASKLNEFEKINNMKDKLKNSKTLNLSLINKNLIRSNNNSDKNIIKLSPRNDSKINEFNQNNKDNNDLKYNDTLKICENKILKESEIGIYENNKNFNEKNSNLINTDRFHESDPQRSRAQRHWSIVLNVIRALKNLRNINVHNVNSITDVDRAIDKWQNDFTKSNKKTDNSKKISYDDSFNIIGDQILLFDYIANGHEENNENILKIIKKERRIKINKDLIHEEEEKENLNIEKNHIIVNLVNHMNIDGFTPLYFACLNGHVKMVDLLIKNGADHLLKCGDKDKGEDDSVLNLSVRWNHIGVVEYLLNNLNWPLSYLKEALTCAKGIKNKILIKLIINAIQRNQRMYKNNSCCLCLIF